MKDISRIETERKTSFASNILMLASAEVIIKLLGFLYKIVMINVKGFGDLGNGYYSTGYQIYTVMLALSSIGIPSVIAKLVSEKVVKGDMAGAHRIYKIALWLFTGIGLTLSLALFFGADMIASHILHNPGVTYTLQVLAPAITFISASAVMRGYFTGLGSLKATSVSQVIEQIFNCLLTIVFVYICIGKDITIMAAAGNLSTTFSVVISLGYMIRFYQVRRKEIHLEIHNQAVPRDKRSTRQLLRVILAISIPTTLGALMAVLNSTIDTITVSNCIQEAYRSIITDSKQLSDKAMELYGLLQKVENLTHLPLAISATLCTAIVPVISSALAKKNTAEAQRKLSDALFISVAFIIPCAIGLTVLAKPILLLIYPQAPDGSRILQLSTITMIFTAMTYVLNGVFYGMGKPKTTAIMISIGIAIKLALNLVLISNPQINIYGAVISSMVCQGFVFIGEFIVLNRYIQVEMPFSKFMKPVAASLLMGAAVWAFLGLLSRHIGSSLSTVIAILLGVAVYILAALLLKMVTKEDLLHVPYGDKAYRFLRKLRLIN